MSRDEKIIELLFQRKEDALAEIQDEYGLLCRKVAFGVLRNNEDTEECLNTAYLKVWNSVPPNRPDSLRAYICRIVRNNAFDMYEKKKRDSLKSSFDELSEIITDPKTIESFLDGRELSEYLNGFLEGEKPLNRKLFVARYYYNMSVEAISGQFGIGEATVKVRLFRIRKSLKKYLSERGVKV